MAWNRGICLNLCDNKIIECALDGKAEYIVTGDPDLLELEEFKGVKILTANEFLNL